MTDALPELGRWSDPAVLVLSSLASGEKHGYALDGRRRPYRITAAGQRALREQPTTIAAVADTGLSRLRASDGLA